MRYFLNQATGKLELHFERSKWFALSEAKKAEVRSVCLWSKRRNCWVSRSTRDHRPAIALAQSLGLEDGGTVGEQTTFAEKLEAKQERAVERAERAEEQASKARQEAEARFNSRNIETLRGLQGEPVKLGHHSARRHLALIERADNDMRRGVEALDKATHYDHRAEAAANTADAPELRNRAFLDRRIKECEAEIRDLTRRLEHGNDASRERIGRLIRHEEERLTFYRGKLDAIGGIPHSQETIRVGMHIKARHGWWQKVLRVNRRTISGEYLEGPCQGWKVKTPFAEIKEVRDTEEQQTQRERGAS